MTTQSKRQTAICVGLAAVSDPTVIWTDGTSVAACGRTDLHTAHTFKRQTASGERGIKLRSDPPEWWAGSKEADPRPAQPVVEYNHRHGGLAAEACSDPNCKPTQFECWTCVTVCYQNGIQRLEPLALDNPTFHRAAGHDVREVKP